MTNHIGQAICDAASYCANRRPVWTAAIGCVGIWSLCFFIMWIAPLKTVEVSYPGGETMSLVTTANFTECMNLKHRFEANALKHGSDAIYHCVA